MHYRISGIPIVKEDKVEKLKTFFYIYFYKCCFNDNLIKIMTSDKSKIDMLKRTRIIPEEYFSDKLKIDMLMENGITTGIMFVETEKDLSEFNNEHMDKSHVLKIELQ